MIKRRGAWAVVVLTVLGLLYPLGAVQQVSAATRCDVSVSAPADLQARLDQAGAGATVCLSGTFGTKSTISPLNGQTIIGGKLTYTGSYDLCWPCGLTDGYNLKAGGITLRHVEVVGFEGKGVLCGPHTTVRHSYLHGNKENGIGCWMESGDWHINIAHNRVTHNGDPSLEFKVSAGIKVLQASRPAHALKAGAWIHGNVSADNYGNGIWLDRSSSGSTIERNTTYGNTHFGIRCEKCAGPVLIQHNNSYGNDYAGISVRNSAVVTLRDNTTHGNVSHTESDSGLVVAYASKDVKTWPHLGNLHMGYHPHRIVVKDRHLYRDGVMGCPIRHVFCSR